MSTKRAKLREEKRRQKQMQRFTILACTVALALIAAGIAWFMLDRYAKSYVMVYEGEKIDTNDLRFCGLFVAAEEGEDAAAVKEKAMDQLQTYLALEKAARDNNLTLTDEEREESLSYAASMKSYYAQNYGLDMSFISDERMADFLGLDVLYGPLQEKFTADLVIDETDFEKALADYTQNNRMDYYDVQILEITAAAEETIQEAKQAVEGGMSFADAVAAYSEAYNEEYGVNPMALRYAGLSDETAQTLLDMESGAMSEIVETDGSFALYYIDSKTIPSSDELAETYRTQYTGEKKGERFVEIIEEWKSAAVYTVNPKGYDAA